VPHWCPPDAESPFASLRCYLAEDNIDCCLNRHYPVLIAHMGSWARPKPSFRLRLSLLRKVFAGCCQSLLRVDLSRRYLCNPYMGAWTLTPQCFFGALTRFFPKNFGLTLDLRRSAHHTASAMQLQQSTLFRGCSHFVMFRLPCLLDPQVAPTAEAHSLRAAGPFTPRNEHVVTHMSCGIATCLNRAIDMAGLSPAGLQPCRPLPLG
jgi:hypothetical protein